jgi:hypothetical protein
MVVATAHRRTVSMDLIPAYGTPRVVDATQVSIA